MKKNIAMRVAAFLFILTMISTCAFATTFAKYTTADHADDTARVAKWGVRLDMSAPGSSFLKAYDDATAPTVKSSNEQKVVAPGTSGILFEFSISGKPEVDAQVSVSLTFTLENWEVAGAYYCPLVVYVNTTPIKGTNYTSAKDFQDAIIAAVKVDEKYECEGNAEIDVEKTVTWEWAFEGSAGSTQTNEKDTALGNSVDLVNGKYPKITFEVSASVNQLN